MRVAILANFPLHVIPSFGAGFSPEGHFATWLPPLAEANAQDDGIARYWITLCDTITERKDATYWNQKFIALPSAKSGRASSLFKADRAAIAKVLEEIQPDLVHGWGTEDAYAFAAATSGYPCLISMQGILSHYVLCTETNSRIMFQALLELYIAQKARHFTCESPWAQTIMQRRTFRGEVTRVEYGVDDVFFETAWHPDANRPVALFAGSLVSRKGFQDVLKAFHSDRLKNFELWVAGDGPLGKRESAPENIKWLGRLNRTQLNEKMSQAWCLVIPTRADTGPTIVKEARVIGLPVVTTRHGGQSNYIEENRNGYFVESGDIPTLTTRLEKLLSNYGFCVERGKDGWEKDRDSFRPALTAKNFADLYRRLRQKTSA